MADSSGEDDIPDLESVSSSEVRRQSWFVTIACGTLIDWLQGRHSFFSCPVRGGLGRWYAEFKERGSKEQLFT